MILHTNADVGIILSKYTVLIVCTVEDTFIVLKWRQVLIVVDSLLNIVLCLALYIGERLRTIFGFLSGSIIKLEHLLYELHKNF